MRYLLVGYGVRAALPAARIPLYRLVRAGPLGAALPLMLGAVESFSDGPDDPVVSGLPFTECGVDLVA